MDLTAICDPTKDQNQIRQALPSSAPAWGQAKAAFEWHVRGFGARNQRDEFLDERSQPFVCPNRRYHVFACGEIYDAPCGVNSLPGLLDHFLKFDTSGWEKVNGQFVFMVYDSHRRTLRIINDRFGFVPSYYCVQGSTFFFGTRIKSILTMLPQRGDLLPLGVAQLLFFGHHFGDTTLFRDIRCLPPASILTFDGQRLELQRYWRATYRPDPRVSTAEFADHMQTAVRRQLRGDGRKSILLSGGIDSRVIAHLGTQEDRSIEAFTFGAENTRDGQYARQVCDVLGLRHHLLHFEPGAWKQSIPKLAELTEGEADIRHFQSLQFHSEMKQHADVLLSGIFGGMFGGHLPPEHLRRLPHNQVCDIALRKAFNHPINDLERIVQNDQFSKLIEECRHVIRSTVDPDVDTLAADILARRHLEYHQRRLISIGPVIDRRMFIPRAPFCDYDLVDFILRVPASLRSGRRFYLNALWKMMPELRHIPWQKSGLPPDPNDLRLACRRLSMRVARKARKMFGLARPEPARSYVNLGDLIRSGFQEQELVGILCGNEQRWHLVINPHEVNRIVHEHFSSPRDHATYISKFLTLHYSENRLLDSPSTRTHL